MNMQSQLQAAIAAAQSAQTATEIKQANDMADSYVEKTPRRLIRRVARPGCSQSRRRVVNKNPKK